MGCTRHYAALSNHTFPYFSCASEVTPTLCLSQEPATVENEEARVVGKRDSLASIDVRCSL